jgi:hypothetical protein
MTGMALNALLALGSGSAIGLVLGLVGGGGSILAVPLLVYLVGVPSPHIAIGTAALAVAANAAMGLAAHARQGTVRWPCALVFAAAGSFGAAIGAAAGKAIDGKRLLALFGLAMIAVGISMLRRAPETGAVGSRLSHANAQRLVPRLLASGAGVGLLSGFFGIGGGFLIVPALMFATEMPIASAIGTSLVAVTAFGLTTAGSYAASGLVDWWLASLLLAGGAMGVLAAMRLGRALAETKGLLTHIFAIAVVMVGVIVAFRGVTG